MGFTESCHILHAYSVTEAAWKFNYKSKGWAPTLEPPNHICLT